MKGVMRQHRGGGAKPKEAGARAVKVPLFAQYTWAETLHYAGHWGCSRDTAVGVAFLPLAAGPAHSGCQVALLLAAGPAGQRARGSWPLWPGGWFRRF